MTVRNLPEKIDECIDLLYSSLSDSANLPGAVESIRKVLDAGTASLFSLDSNGIPLSFTAANHDLAIVERWTTHYAYMDPYSGPCQAARPGQWVTDDSLLDPVRSPQRQYVNEFAIGAHMRWLTGGKIMEDPSTTAFFTVHRPSTMKPFGSDTLAALDTLYPHLNRVSRLATRFARPLAALKAANDAMDMLAIAACGVDARGGVVYVNRAMEALLGSNNVVRVRGRRLEFASADAEAKLRAAVVRLASSGIGRSRAVDRMQPTSLSIPVDADTTYLVRMVPMAVEGEPMAANVRAARIMVFVTRTPTALDGRQLQETFGLTSAESEVLRLLAAGLGPEQCASARGVSVATVRSQLSSMLHKAGVTTQAQLVSLALGVPRTF